MRKPKYLSPTSLDLFFKNQREYYLTYLADVKPPRIPQTAPMAVGSAFDAFVKNHLHQGVFGSNDPQFEVNSIFEQQVEPQNRDEGKKAGAYLFLQYQKSGALADLLLDLTQASVAPRFEFAVEATIDGVPFMGKPDLWFTHKEGGEIILDWKVNGYYSNTAPSPAPGYVRIRDANGLKPGHKAVIPMFFKGVKINAGTTLDLVKPEWAVQLSIYSWVLGTPVGSEFITAIDQVVCKKTAGFFPDVRFAEHRLKVSKAFQENTFNRAKAAWNVINGGHYFTDVSLEESVKQCEMLDKTATSLKGDGSSNDQWFSDATRSR